ncbi:acyl-CoA dehydrogenase family protein [Asanoa sp. WMMD1127]|uniref:acyl-CoA dehydrogenase family protein n=1 Tax=Asanoa sp. WMMD1127 TaxID=3016107 RepID=UPI0024163BE0|nr:acyl-CoA dehydrogenase family protein [Asanoa sp. WMMD1127]MDG4820784.1 acyl-CoA dehydrogenase family protein [Asanoa sp. WMMD1127]
MTGSNAVPPPAYQSAAALEQFLGDPDDDGTPASFAASVEADDAGEMPVALMAALREWEFPALLVPEALGGRLRTFEELFAVSRVVARRDVRAAVSYGTALLGANPVWLWGDADQRGWLADRLRGGDLGSFAMSERDHGSDLAGCQVVARPDGSGGYLLSGEKWPIGNATRGTFATVYARTGPRDFSLLLLDKAALPARRWSNTPRVPTLGLRGHDMSGIVFDECPVPGAAVLGRPGTGIAQTLKALQVTRTLIGALSLGSLDTALRIALGHGQRRVLYGAAITALPVVRDVLVRAYLDLLVGECVAVPATRAISVAPDRLSLWSGIVKYFVPTTVEQAVADLRTVLSARGYLRDALPARAFQKLDRDQAIAGIFEGTTHVNLGGIAAQLPFVLTRPAPGEADDDLLTALFDRSREATPWTPDGRRLQLTNGGRDEITASWSVAVERVLARPGAGAPLRAVLAELDTAWARARAHYEGASPVAAAREPQLLAFSMARTHCVLHAAACLLWTWLHDDAAGDDLLVACLERLVQRLAPERQLSPEAADAVWDALLSQASGRQLFSLTPLPLGGPVPVP